MTEQQTLVEFIEARLAEDWEVARAAITPVGGTWEATGGVEVVGETKGRQVWEWTVCFNEGSPSEAQADHIARHDPARVLHEVDAKRAIIEDHPIQSANEPGEHDFGCARCYFDRDEGTYGMGYCTTLKSLAAVYSDHEAYREEWKP